MDKNTDNTHSGKQILPNYFTAMKYISAIDVWGGFVPCFRKMWANVHHKVPQGASSLHYLNVSYYFSQLCPI